MRLDHLLRHSASLYLHASALEALKAVSSKPRGVKGARERDMLGLGSEEPEDTYLDAHQVSLRVWCEGASIPTQTQLRDSKGLLTQCHTR